MVVVVIGAVRVPSAVVKGSRVAGRRGREIAPINGEAIQGIACMRWVHSQVLRAPAICVVSLTVKACGTKGVAVQVRLAPTLRTESEEGGRKKWRDEKKSKKWKCGRSGSEHLYQHEQPLSVRRRSNTPVQYERSNCQALHLASRLKERRGECVRTGKGGRGRSE